MIHDQRTSRIVAQAKQQRAEFIQDFLKSHPVAVVFVIAFAALMTTIDWNTSSDVAAVSHQPEQVTHVSKR